MMGMHFGHFCKDLECEIENQGGKLVITLSGDAEKIAMVERKLKALKELCHCGEEGGGCC